MGYPRLSEDGSYGPHRMIFLSYVAQSGRISHDTMSWVRQSKDKLVINRQQSRRQCSQPNGQICPAAYDRDVILIRTVIRTICKNARPHETKKHMIAWQAASSLMLSADHTIRTSLTSYMSTEE